MYSKIIAGTMTWGSWGKDLNQKQMSELITTCMGMGITAFDHADIYGGYTNEAAFGQALAETKIDRASIQLISKCGIQYVCAARNNTIKHYDYSPEYIIWSAEESLRNLQTDYLDLFLLHRPSPLMHPEVIAGAVSKLKKEGKIRSFGVSNFTPSQIAMLGTTIPVSANQVEFSLTTNAVMYDGTLDDCIARKRVAMCWSPLGNYFKEDSEQVSRIHAVMAPLENKYEASADQLLLAWLLRHPAGVYPVVGTTEAHRLEKALQAVNIQLELEDWFSLLEAAQGHKVP